MIPATIDFSEALIRWRIHIADLVERGSAKILQGVLYDRDNNIPEPGLVGSKPVTDRAKEFLSEQLIPACLRWLKDLQISSPPPEKMTADIARLLDPFVNLLFLRIRVIESPTPLGFAFAAGTGATLGILLLSLYPVDLANANAGVALAGCAGAVSAVLLFNGIARWWQSSVVVRRQWRRRGSASRIGPSALFADQLGQCLRHSADVILAWFWAQADGLEAGPAAASPAAPEATSRIPAPLAEEDPLSVFEAIEHLACALGREDIDLQEVRDIGQEIIQRYQDEGFEWKTVEEGAPYDETTAQLFNTFGHIEPGQPVKTLQPALLRKGVLKKRGLLRRIRPK